MLRIIAKLETFIFGAFLSLLLTLKYVHFFYLHTQQNKVLLTK